MSEQAWTYARLARDELAARLLDHPTVSMVDLGLGDSEEPVVRVHLRSASEPPPEIPMELDGIAVRVVRGDYELEAR